MAPEEASKPETAQPVGPGPSAPARRDRRPSRGRRGRGGRGRSKHPVPRPVSQLEPATSAEEPEPIIELATERAGEGEAVASPAEPDEAPSEPASSASVVQPAQPASPASVQEAIDEVNGVIDALREALDEMEGVLEMLELFERQKNADEREIESLRRALRQVHRPRDGGHQQHR